MSRLSGSSSTTTTRSPARRALGPTQVPASSPRSGADRTLLTISGSLTMNVAPLPSPRLSASTVPPCSSVRCFTSASPSPSPPWARVLELSPCRKRSKMYGMSWASMPTPVSATTISARAATPRRLTRTWPDAGVNLIALATRFQTTCWRRSGSPRTGLARGSRTDWIRMLLASAVGRTASSAASITGTRLIARVSSRSLPLTMRDTSSRSLTSWASARPLRSMASSARADVAGSRLIERSMPTQPMTALSGVRSSCERTARNWSLLRLASSATARSLSRSSSARWRSVTSRVMPMTPTIRPVASRYGALVDR